MLDENITMIEECGETIDGLNILMNELRLDDTVSNQEILDFILFMFEAVGGC